MAFGPNDVIPLGYGDNYISLLVTDNGLEYLPPQHTKDGRGNGDYWAVSVSTDNLVNVTALRLLGVKPRDIELARNYRK